MLADVPEISLASDAIQIQKAIGVDNSVGSAKGLRPGLWRSGDACSFALLQRRTARLVTVLLYRVVVTGSSPNVDGALE
jgi:hypothetical protein